MSATQPAPRRSRTETFKGFFSKFKGHGRKPATAGRPRAFSISRPQPARVQPEEIEAETRSEAGSLATLDDHSGDVIVSAKGHPRDTKDPGYWGPTRNIPESDLVNLVKRQLRDEWNGKVKELDFQLKRSVSGGFNTAYILKSAMLGTICIRVPASGWPYRWNEIDADLTRASALGMKYVFEKSRLPVPELLAFDVSLDNEIRAPYVMMSFIEGTDVEKLWDPRTEHTAVIERKRQMVLQNLAMLMPRLQATQFSKGGGLWFPHADEREPVVGSTWHLRSPDIFVIRRDFRSEPCQRSVKQLLLEGKEKRSQDITRAAKEKIPFRTGAFMLWSLMIDAFLQSASIEPGEPEFVLMQSDFNPPNIMTREDGEIVGLIDWDCLKAVPRQVGWCSIPHWLQHDWHDDWSWPMTRKNEKPNLHPSEYSRYRQDYVRYMYEACDRKGDCRFTSKSHIYQALFDSLEVFKKVEYLVVNVLADIVPRNTRHLRRHVERIGSKGWCSKEGEMEWYQAQFLEYFRPEIDS